MQARLSQATLSDVLCQQQGTRAHGPVPAPSVWSGSQAKMILILLHGWGGRLEESYLATCEDHMKHLSPQRKRWDPILPVHIGVLWGCFGATRQRSRLDLEHRPPGTLNSKTFTACFFPKSAWLPRERARLRQSRLLLERK